MSKKTQQLLKALPPQAKARLVTMSLASEVPAMDACVELINYAWHQFKRIVNEQKAAADKENSEQSTDNEGASDSAPTTEATT